jgi:hypothetical protein
MRILYKFLSGAIKIYLGKLNTPHLYDYYTSKLGIKQDLLNKPIPAERDKSIQ